MVSLENGSKIDILGKTALNEFLASNTPEYVEIEKRVEVEPIENACHIARQTLWGMRDKFNTTDVQVYLTGTSNFRKDIATILPYKGNRDPFDKPKLLPDVRNYLVNVWKAEIVEGME